MPIPGGLLSHLSDKMLLTHRSINTNICEAFRQEFQESAARAYRGTLSSGTLIVIRFVPFLIAVHYTANPRLQPLLHPREHPLPADCDPLKRYPQRMV
jgi:hypothetical protein